MKPEMKLRTMIRSEVDLLLEWAAEEGWKPGLEDADAFWAADNDAYIAAEIDNEIIGGGATVRYSGELGFMGLFIIRPDFRNQGLGRTLWHYRRDLLISRMSPNGTIGMMAVENMKPFYEKGGFKYFGMGTRYGGKVDTEINTQATVLDLVNLDFKQVVEFDRKHFGAYREAFWRKWIKPKSGRGLALMNRHGTMEAMGVIREVVDGGYKIGPLFAISYSSADILFRALAKTTQLEELFIDIPSNNPNAGELVNKYGLEERFRCALMYRGKPPSLPWNEIYGFTTFELG